MEPRCLFGSYGQRRFVGLKEFGKLPLLLYYRSKERIIKGELHCRNPCVIPM